MAINAGLAASWLDAVAALTRRRKMLLSRRTPAGCSLLEALFNWPADFSLAAQLQKELAE